MQIIKKGDLDRLKNSIRFNCKKCGCVFIADNDEYQKHFDQYQGNWIEIHCPCCNNRIIYDC
jgi:hypothetical protein